MTPAICATAVRRAPLFAAADSATTPLPVRRAVGSASHCALLATVHSQLADVATATSPDPPAVPISIAVGDTENEHVPPAAWVTAMD